jgi:hypothetical protein
VALVQGGSGALSHVGDVGVEGAAHEVGVLCFLLLLLKFNFILL